MLGVGSKLPRMTLVIRVGMHGHRCGLADANTANSISPARLIRSTKPLQCWPPSRAAQHVTIALKIHFFVHDDVAAAGIGCGKSDVL